MYRIISLLLSSVRRGTWIPGQDEERKRKLKEEEEKQFDTVQWQSGTLRKAWRVAEGRLLCTVQCYAPLNHVGLTEECTGAVVMSFQTVDWTGRRIFSADTSSGQDEEEGFLIGMVHSVEDALGIPCACVEDSRGAW